MPDEMSESSARSPSETLRAAAARIRPLGAAANPAPWFVERGGGIHMDGTSDYHSIRNGRAPAIAQIGYRGQSADWIAMFSPSVAEPLAAWLDVELDRVECGYRTDVLPHALRPFDPGAAMTLLRLLACGVFGATAAGVGMHTGAPPYSYQGYALLVTVCVLSQQKTQMAISYARSTREETRPLEMLPDWRNSHLVLRDDNGEKLNPRDFGLQAADRIKSAYVLAHPEMPWPQWIISQAQKIAPERTEP